MKRLLGALLACATLGAPAHAGPFGLDMGMSVGEIERLGRVLPDRHARNVYSMPAVPLPDGAFASYKLFVTPLFGLCKILAVTPVIRTDGGGRTLRAAFREMEKKLVGRYGPGQRFDGPTTAGAPDAPGEWMRTLAGEQRALHIHWEDAGDVRVVKLEANALGPDRGYLLAGYEFSNFRSCLAEDRDNAP